MIFINKIKAYNYLLIIIFFCLISFIYQIDIYVNNISQGYKEVIIDLFRVVYLCLFGLIIANSIPAYIKKPSDIFITLYSIFVLLPCVLFTSVTENSSYLHSIFLFIILYAPVVLLNLSDKLKFEVKSFNFFNPIISDFIFYIIILLSIITSYRMGNSIGGFSFDAIYDRRISGRDIFVAGSFVAYLFAMVANGISNLFAFVGGIKSKINYFLFSFLFSVYCFWLLGQKSPLAYTIVFYFIGKGVRNVGVNFKLSRNVLFFF